jgi:nicotinamidase-related amidase
MNTQEKKYQKGFSIKEPFVFIFLAVLLASCASTGEKIANYENPQKALIVIDMQLDFTGEKANMPIEAGTAANLINVVNHIIDDYNGKGYQIVYIKNVYKKHAIANLFQGNVTIEGTAGTEIDPRIHLVSGNIFDKNKGDAFTTKAFEQFLINNRVNEIFVCGIMAHGCVYYTALGGQNRNYTVNYIANAVGAPQRKNIENTIKKLKNKGVTITEWFDK